MDVTLTVMTWQINRNLIQRLADTRTSSGSYILRCFREYRNIICFCVSHLRSGDSLLGYSGVPLQLSIRASSFIFEP